MLQYASLAKYPAAKEQIALFAKMILVAILKVVVFAFYLHTKCYCFAQYFGMKMLHLLFSILQGTLDMWLALSNS